MFWMLFSMLALVMFLWVPQAPHLMLVVAAAGITGLVQLAIQLKKSKFISPL